MEKTNDVIALGAMLVDLLIEVDETKLTEMDLKKGEMHLVEEEKAKEILTNIQQHNPKIAPGGSAANTIRALGLLGSSAILCGKVGNDDHGRFFIEELQNHNVISRVNTHPKTTGHCISFITPDAERTLSTYLGAATEFFPEDILEEDIQKSKVLHIEGYQLEGPTKATAMYAMQLAKKHNTLVSLDLADPGLIRRNKEFFQDIVANYVDIVFVNEKEALEFTGKEEEEALLELAKHSKIAVVKLGEKGSLIHHNNQTTKVPAVLTKAVDTTGAGDTFAAGFLHGYCNGWNMEKSGKLGSLLASKVVENMGVHYKHLDMNEIKNGVETKMENHKNNLKIGIIGGSGLDNPNILQDAHDVDVKTPFGKPTSHLKVGKINNIDVVLLARHGREHTIPPTQVNYRANIHALKEAGCTHILATTACGSLREEIGRGDFVILDQFIDFTRHRTITFHEEFAPGKMVHTPMAEPFSQEIREAFTKTCEELNIKHHKKGTVVTIEGPRFSTKAESHMFRSWGADVINMSIAPEATLANEVGIPYAAVAMSTDYDCWKEDEEPVTWEEVLKVFEENVGKVTDLLVNAIPKLSGSKDDCCCANHEEHKAFLEKKTEEEVKVEVYERTDDEIKNDGPFDLKSTIRTIPNWPKEGIMFRDITSLIENPKAFAYTIQKLVDRYKDANIDKIAGIESRGFIFGAPLAKELGIPFVLIRKKGKLPGETVSQEYQLEYGTDQIEIHKNSIKMNDNVLVVDDLLATGGTMKAACRLVEKLNGNVAGVAFVIDLPELKGREKLAGYDLFHLVKFEGE
jgi:5'-methylthioadenosine phosphorylase